MTFIFLHYLYILYIIYKTNLELISITIKKIIPRQKIRVYA